MRLPGLNRLKRLIRSAFVTILAISQFACSRSADSVLDHDLSFQYMGRGKRVVSLRPLDLRGHQAVVVVSVGRGLAKSFADSDNDPSPNFVRIGDIHTYSAWPRSGTGLYSRDYRADEVSPAVRVATPPEDEVTLAGVAAAGSRIVDVSWTEVLAGQPHRSRPVTTTGEATLIAFWWGDADVGGRKLAIPSHGFRVVDSILKSGALVQGAVAVRRVSKAGTYDVKWYAAPKQGAQLWLVAIQ